VRHIFIGDIQGCREELEALLHELRFDPAADVLLPVGDLVNRGPDSLGTLRLLRQLGAQPVLGNHELHLFALLAGRRASGKRDTLGKLLASSERDELVAWLRAAPFVRRLGRTLLVHAGVHPRWRDPERELAGADPSSPTPAALFAARARYCDEHGNLPARDDVPPGPPFRPWHAWIEPARLGLDTIVFGHWAAQGLHVRAGFRGLDTGCVWGRELSAWIREEDRIVTVPARRVYAPIE
jgi:bis(5'-nucleosyl)-tetraphosphatase (symmetrical)